MKNSVNIICFVLFAPPRPTHTSAESGAVNSKTQKNLRTSQCVWNRNLKPRRYRTNCVTAAIHCGTGTWNLRHSSRGTRTWGTLRGVQTGPNSLPPYLYTYMCRPPSDLVPREVESSTVETDTY